MLKKKKKGKKKRTFYHRIFLISLIIFKALPVSQLEKFFTSRALLIPQENTVASQETQYF